MLFAIYGRPRAGPVAARRFRLLHVLHAANTESGAGCHSQVFKESVFLGFAWIVCSNVTPQHVGVGVPAGDVGWEEEVAPQKVVRMWAFKLLQVEWSNHVGVCWSHLTTLFHFHWFRSCFINAESLLHEIVGNGPELGSQFIFKHWDPGLWSYNFCGCFWGWYWCWALGCDCPCWSQWTATEVNTFGPPPDWSGLVDPEPLLDL